ncbi:MAG: hypothetical protein DRP01_05625 [Archaeoglobales archaeon]|nr:MAG: hypothetical protein DRP01_05625 [Archaeoglobales archaeon]
MKSLKVLLNLGLAEEVRFNGLKFYQASIPYYDSQIATLLKLHGDYVILTKIARDELTLKVLEQDT